MGDRYFALTVVLDKAMRDEDSAPLLAAIGMLKGVANVMPHVAEFLPFVSNPRDDDFEYLDTTPARLGMA